MHHHHAIDKAIVVAIETFVYLSVAVFIEAITELRGAWKAVAVAVVTVQALIGAIEVVVWIVAIGAAITFAQRWWWIGRELGGGDA